MLREGNQILGKYLQYLSLKVIIFLDYHIIYDMYTRLLFQILAPHTEFAVQDYFNKCYKQSL